MFDFDFYLFCCVSVCFALGCFLLGLGGLLFYIPCYVGVCFIVYASLCVDLLCSRRFC